MKFYVEKDRREEFLYADTSRGKPWNKNPAVIRFGDHYLMFHSLLPDEGKGEKGRRHGIAVSADLIHWEKVGKIPPHGRLDLWPSNRRAHLPSR
jgi:hypothetical protein